MENLTVSTPKRITGTGLYDNGQYADSYNKTEHFEVSISLPFVTYSRIVNGHVSKGTSRQLLEYITNKDILEAVKKLQANLC